jgi:hypothetical protein
MDNKIDIKSEKYFLFEKPEKKVENDITWYIVKLKPKIELQYIYDKEVLNDDCMKELNSIRNKVIESLTQSDSLFSKKPTVSSLSMICLPFFTIGDKRWSPVVKWSCDCPEQFKIVLSAIYISRSSIVPFFECREHKVDVIDFDLNMVDAIHPDLEEFDGATLMNESEVVTLRNLKKERMEAKMAVKVLFRKAYEAEEEFVRKYGQLEDDESTFSSESDFDSDSSSD